MSKSNPTNSARAISYFNSRKPIETKHVGQQVILMVQGEGTLITKAEQMAKDVAAGAPARTQYFDQYIYNLNANSLEAVSRPETKQLLKDAIEGEKAGVDAEQLDELFTKWLNAGQMSFSVIADPNRRKYENGDQVKVTLGTAKTKASYDAIIVEKHAYMAPVVIAKAKFDLTELLA